MSSGAETKSKPELQVTPDTAKSLSRRGVSAISSLSVVAAGLLEVAAAAVVVEVANYVLTASVVVMSVSGDEVPIGLVESGVLCLVDGGRGAHPPDGGADYGPRHDGMYFVFASPLRWPFVPSGS